MFDDRLLAFAVEQADRADWRITAEWCARYPDLAVSLMAFTATWQLGAGRAEPPD